MKPRRPLPVRRPAAPAPTPSDDTPAELRNQFAALHRTLLGDVHLKQGAANLGVDPERLDIYRGFVRGHIRNAVGANFNLTEAWIRHGSPAAWRWILEQFVARARPEHWTLDAAAGGFAELIGGLVGQPLPPASGAGDWRPDVFAGALATLEWSMYLAHVDPVDLTAPADPAEAPAGHRLNPTLEILELAEGVGALAATLNRDALPEHDPVATGGTEHLWVLRRPQTERAMFLRPHTDHWFAFKAVYEGLDAAAAAAATGQPLAAVEAAYAEGVRAGVILAV